MPISDEEVVAEDEFYCNRRGYNVTPSVCKGECDDEGLEGCNLTEEDE